MTRDQIKAELRRSACEDADPWFDCAAAAMIFCACELRGATSKGGE